MDILLELASKSLTGAKESQHTNPMKRKTPTSIENMLSLARGKDQSVPCSHFPKTGAKIIKTTIYTALK